MNTTKTLLLAGFAALSLGVGVASAQNLAPSAREGSFFSAPRQTTTLPANGVQSGSSDVDTTRTSGALPYDYTTLANPG
jgi:hypothetical protein